MLTTPIAPQQASSFSYHYDVVFWATTALTILFTVLVYALVIVFAVRYRQGNKVDRSRPHHEHLLLEITWTAIPTLLGLGMFFFGTQLFIRMRVPPDDAQDVYVIGKQWMWHIQHANGVRENNTLHVPIGKPIKLTMISQDVIHAFYIPDFRVQFHVVPGRYTQAWFTATKPGRYPIFCGMYCGTQHSEMGGYVYAMEPQEYQRWLENGGNLPTAMTMEERGERLFSVLGCGNSCHVGTDTLGAPSLHNLYGRQRQLADGSVRADEAYLREAILRPATRLVAGYGPTMPNYEGQISEEDVLNLISYIKTLGGGADNVGQTLSRDEPQKGLIRPGTTTGAGGVPPTQPQINAAQTNLPETGAAVNAVAEENRTQRR